jgi:hypothetical protein
MHPRSTKDVLVTDRELVSARRAAEWFDEALTDLMLAVNADFRARLDTP